MANKVDRYLKIVDWARKRYTDANGIVVSVGGTPSRYSIIENLAAMKILGCHDHWRNV